MHGQNYTASASALSRPRESRAIGRTGKGNQDSEGSIAAERGGRFAGEVQEAEAAEAEALKAASAGDSNTCRRLTTIDNRGEDYG
jgi:hypothetical protein